MNKIVNGGRNLVCLRDTEVLSLSRMGVGETDPGQGKGKRCSSETSPLCWVNSRLSPDSGQARHRPGLPWTKAGVPLKLRILGQALP